MPRLRPATATPPGLVHRPDIRNEFKRPYLHMEASREHYQELLQGTVRSQNTATLALPALPLLGGRRVHAIWPASTRIERDGPTQNLPTGEQPRTPQSPRSLMTTPAIHGADGTKLGLTAEPGAIYSLLQSRGSRLNGAFRSWGGRQSALERIGLLLITAAGYSRIDIGGQMEEQVLARVNGLPLQAGQSIRLADGGLLHASRDAQHFYISSPQSHTTSIDIQHTRSGPLMGLSLHPIPQKNEIDPLSFDGLLAQTFQSSYRPRHIDQDGESYRGSIEELRVSSGLFGPAPAAPQSSFFPTDNTLGPVYQHYFGMPPELPFIDLDPQDIAQQWQWINQQSVQLELIQNAAARERKLREQERKQELLLAAALKGGNIDLAILLLSATETQAANDLTRRLVLRIHQLQKQRQTLSAQMGQVGKTEDAEGTSQLQSLVTQASNVATEISLLQTFLQDAVASKRNIQEFASNWIQQSHQTTRSIIQSIGR